MCTQTTRVPFHQKELKSSRMESVITSRQAQPAQAQSTHPRGTPPHTQTQAQVRTRRCTASRGPGWSCWKNIGEVISPCPGHHRDSQGPCFLGMSPLCQPPPTCPSHWCNNFSAILQAEESGIVLGDMGSSLWGGSARRPLGAQREFWSPTATRSPLLLLSRWVPPRSPHPQGALHLP